MAVSTPQTIRLLSTSATLDAAQFQLIHAEYILSHLHHSISRISKFIVRRRQ
jgi:hypothetical protein